jgi:nucleotide-binding universal stress UspA family protein
MKTKKLAKILIALDFNPTAQKVAEQGYALAKSMNAEVTLLHVISDPINFNSPSHVTVMGFVGYVQTDSENIHLDSIGVLNKAAHEYLEKTKVHLGDKTIMTEVRDGDFAEKIIEVAGEMHADIIVLGSHSQKWLENIIMGSVSEKVLRLSTIPLFIVPTKKRE